MVKIRLSRTGQKGTPSYRIVVSEAASKRDGRVIETIGLYQPLNQPATFELDQKRYSYWLSVGAKPTETVARLSQAARRR